MTISSIGSTFSYIPLNMTITKTAPEARIAEAAESSATNDDGTPSGNSEQALPDQTAPDHLAHETAKPPAGILVAIQIHTTTTVGSREAAAAYGAGCAIASWDGAATTTHTMDVVG
ncbi:hypothetical protein [Labrys monachus]|uniref:Uncharacterized protein n=1 Tax=Labrys monachus TaxID=217067 RepID=A0ABU0F725_9HYPH|nr:hypothetical protein [Labrys monachus]MDQ0390409.1 hypothetical protein [Labrys monachus]